MSGLGVGGCCANLFGYKIIDFVAVLACQLLHLILVFSTIGLLFLLGFDLLLLIILGFRLLLIVQGLLGATALFLLLKANLFL